MILDTEIEITVGSHSIKHYKELNYPAIWNKKLIVKTEHLSKGSNVLINVQCDICKNIKTLEFCLYNENTKGLIEQYCCSRNCAEDKRKGTLLKNHGDKNFNNRNQAKETCLKKYGTNTPGENENVKKKALQTCVKKYGGNSPTCSIEVRNKSKQTTIKNFGVEHNSQSNIIKIEKKKTKFEHYGDENYTNREQAKKTCMEKYGVENPSQNEYIKFKKTETCQKNYGVDYPMQDPGLHEKAQISGFKLKLHEQTGLKYRGGNEKDFLDYCFNNNIKTEKAPSIKYKFNKKKRTYHPDFYLKEKNLIIEVKSTYTFNDDYEENLAKQESCLKQGYNYIFIIDFNYDEFKKTISEVEAIYN